MRRLFFKIALMALGFFIPADGQAGCSNIYDMPGAGAPVCDWGQSPALRDPCSNYLFDFCDYEFSFAMGPTWREDHLCWSIAGEGGYPNVLSELTWDKVKSWLVDARAKWLISDWLYIRAEGDYGHIFQGNSIDSDYAFNQRRGEYSRSENSAGRGEVFDLLGGIGFQMSFCKKRYKIAPLGGYYYSEQHLRQYNGYQTKPLILLDHNHNVVAHLPPGPIKGLNSSYKTRWQGPWAGVDLSWEVYRDWILFGSFEYLWVTNYKGKGDWNLRHDFIKDFVHTASSGSGVFGSFGTAVRMAYWQLKLLGEVLNLHTDSGTDHTYIEEGEIKTRLNEVRWHSFRLTVLAEYQF